MTTPTNPSPMAKTEGAELVLVERLEKSQPGGKIAVELWCARDLESDKEACALMRAQAAALREMADGLDAFSGLIPPSRGGAS